ncbi:hypothetical protein GCM10011329_08600 [Stakelama pacifica]|nr:hypothetical protein GCM10011329_08600 [Stakelama pacifica]
MGGSGIGPMQRFARRLGVALIVVALLSGAATPPESGPLTVEIENLRSDKGMIRLCLTADEAHFPNCDRDPRAVTRSVPAGQRVILFPGLAPGDYALSVIHDENGNNRLDTFAGIPREGFGFSRNPAIRFGPPRFSAVRFEVGPKTPVQDVRMRYIF